MFCHKANTISIEKVKKHQSGRKKDLFIVNFEEYVVDSKI